MLSGGDGPSKLPLHKFPLIPCSSSHGFLRGSTSLKIVPTKNQQVVASVWTRCNFSVVTGRNLAR